MYIRVKKRDDIIMEKCIFGAEGCTRGVFKENLDLLLTEQKEDMKVIDFLNEMLRASWKRTKEFARMAVKLSNMD